MEPLKTNKTTIVSQKGNQLANNAKEFDLRSEKATPRKKRKKIKKKVHLKDMREVVVLFGVVIVFFICHVLRIILNIDELITNKEQRDIMEEAARNNRSRNMDNRDTV